MAKKPVKTPAKKVAKKTASKTVASKGEIKQKKEEKSEKVVKVTINKAAPVIEQDPSAETPVQEMTPIVQAPSKEQVLAVIETPVEKDFTTTSNEPLQSDRSKAIVMWSCVFVFMVVILAIWTYNFKIIMDSQSAVTNNNTNEQLQQLSSQMRTNLEQFKKDIDELKSLTATTTPSRDDLFRSASSTDLGASSTSSVVSTTTPGSENIKTLKENLEKKQTNGKPQIE